MATGERERPNHTQLKTASTHLDQLLYLVSETAHIHQKSVCYSIFKRLGKIGQLFFSFSYSLK
jgi:hypothetical protein